MPVNEMSFNQLSTVLTEIVGQATGKQVIAPVDSAQFVSVAQTALLTSYDTLVTAVSQVLSRTIFSVRPYYRKFSGLMVDNMRYGNHVRKLQVVDGKWEDDDRIKLVDGQSIDQQKVNKPVVLQTNFYGENIYSKSLTIYRDQLDTAFHSPDEFGRFISMTMQNVTDMIEQAHEATNRATVGNLIGGIVLANPANQVVHLVTEYNVEAGLTGDAALTAETAMQPENFTPFMRWVFARIATISDMLTERSINYHVNVTGKEIARHTPKARQRAYFSAPVLNKVSSTVLSTTYHDNYLRLGDYESVNYWQAIGSPLSISNTPVYMKPDGTLSAGTDEAEVNNLFGVIMDEEAAGVTVVNQWTANAPFNARGGYTNTFWHFTDRYWNDFTENAVVLLLD